MGNALLVCPILREGRRSRKISLQGGCWYNFWRDNIIEGGQTVELEAPLEQIPVLVKAGC
ncbi:MAG: hypothetical protein VKK42_26290 [Lyngbya sp.]|nr:hypothetical protein [Lyngbya sp.]